MKSFPSGLHKLFLTALSLALLLGVASPARPSAVVTSRLHPLLSQLAVTAPHQHVSIIVQKADATTAAEQLTQALNGQVTRDLYFINAFTARIEARHLPVLAESAAVRWISADVPAVNSNEAASVTFTTWATALGAVVTNQFSEAEAMIDEPGFGPDGRYGYRVGNGKGSFAGFSSEIVPGYSITKVELVLQAYANVAFSKDYRIKTYLNGKEMGKVSVKTGLFSGVIGEANVGLVAVDITKTNSWRWADFDDNLEIYIEQAGFSSSHTLYYDAVGLRVTSAPGTDLTGGSAPTSLPKEAIDTSRLRNAFNSAVRATDVWNQGPAYLQGQGVTVAVVDSGIVKNRDLGGRLLKNVSFNQEYHDGRDRHGHGTFVAAIIAGDGRHQDGERIGIAPKANLLNVRISNDRGMSTESEVVAALQWILENKARYNIRVVNLSLNSTVAQSYHTSPMDAAVEILWFNGIVVVASAGNNGSAELYPPANDPFIITVGATDDRGTASLADDSLAHFSACGLSEAGLVKPELVAPGKDIITLLPNGHKYRIGQQYPDHLVGEDFFRMSGTSMSAPMVAGAVALLLQDEPHLTPDQVKYRLMETAARDWPGYDPECAGAGYLDVWAAVHGVTTANANVGVPPSQLLWGGSSSTNWNSVNWESVNWESVNWESVNWESDYWGP